MNAHVDHQIVRHARTFAAFTLVSRLLGLVRDALLARLLGVSGLGTAFNIAFQFPNTFRRLFGEGALSAAFIPEYASLVRQDPELSHRFASLVVALLAAGLGALVLLIELALLALLLFRPTLPEEGRRAVVLLMIMLPYTPGVCVTAILGGMLQTRGRFAAQAAAPVILNLCMIAAALAASRVMGWAAPAVALAVAVSVTVAGVLQIALALLDLRGRVQWARAFHGAGRHARRMLTRSIPVAIGLGGLQIASLIESWVVIAWPLQVGPTILGRPYPIDAAAGAALYNAQRLYQFPLGIFGIALATAAFPALARLADDAPRFAGTLRRSIRLAALIGVPATAGLIWIAQDATAVIYLGGQVSLDDARRIARALVMYAPLVGAYSITHVLTRAFYARGLTRLPTRVSLITTAAGLALGVALMWPLAESGLALGASIAAVCQLIWLLAAARTRLVGHDHPILDRSTRRSLGTTIASTAIMLAALVAAKFLWPAPRPAAYADHAIHLAADGLLGAAAYAAAAWALNRADLQALLGRSAPTSAASAPPVDPHAGSDDQ